MEHYLKEEHKQEVEWWGHLGWCRTIYHEMLHKVNNEYCGSSSNKWGQSKTINHYRMWYLFAIYDSFTISQLAGEDNR